MNIFVEELAEGDIGRLESNAERLVVEDNVGESIHIHLRNTRLEMSIDEFVEFADRMEGALEALDDGHR